jgi:hypothetical protein
MVIARRWMNVRVEGSSFDHLIKAEIIMAPASDGSQKRA